MGRSWVGSRRGQKERSSRRLLVVGYIPGTFFVEREFAQVCVCGRGMALCGGEHIGRRNGLGLGISIM